MIERRAFTEYRAQGRKLEGYAAKFGTEARIADFVETIAPGAFKNALAGDVLALRDHDSKAVLGRTRSGTLRLNEDSQGLHFSLDLPDTQAGRDVQEMAQRGDLGGMSFGFTVNDDGEVWNGDKRILRAINLKEISIVSAWPAYPDTEIALRSRCASQERDRRRRAIAIAEAEAAIWA